MKNIGIKEIEIKLLRKREKKALEYEEDSFVALYMSKASQR
jgi:hypothetical protein